jgi:hypothetical protein
MQSMRFRTFALAVLVLVSTLWARTSFAYPTGVTTGTIFGATDTFGCNNCHGTGTAPSSVTLNVGGGGSVGLVPIPTPMPLPNITLAPSAVAYSLSVTFHNPNSTPSFTPGGGFLVFHTDGTNDSSGILGASTGSQVCPGGVSCPPEAPVSGSKEVTHTARYSVNGSDVTVFFTYQPPPGATACGKYGFRIWLNAVDGNGDCSTVTDQAQAFDFTITVAGPATDGNDCHKPGVCSVSGLGMTGTWSFANWDSAHSCNDGKSCTTSDHCNGSGTCIGTVTCPAIDVCHVAGACDGAGNCTAPPASSATVCNDGKACTTSDHCDGAGNCTGNVNCPALDICHLAGACNGGGTCTTPFAPVTQACNDSNACTGTAGTPDHCNGSGTCVAGATVTCPTPDECHSAVSCVPASGCPALPSQANGTLCGAASSCVGNVFHPHQACTTGVCTSPATVTCNGTCDPTNGCGGCTADSDCLANNYCDNTGTCLPSKTTGTCNTAAGTAGGHCKVAGCKECRSGNCIDGFCCDTTCGNGAASDCIACNVSGKEGTCSPLSSGVACNADSNACTQNDTCDSAGKCQAGSAVVCRTPKACEAAGVCNPADGSCSFALLSKGTVCAKAVCDPDGVTLIQAASCNGTADCPAQQAVSCYPNPCLSTSGQGACGTGCTIDANCAPGAYCDAGNCADKKATGLGCSADNQCESAHCVDGICCGSACSGQCQACDVKGSEGSCVAVSGPPHGKRDVCKTDGGKCGGTCDGKNVDGCAYPDDTTICRDESCDASSNMATLKAGCNGAGSCPAATQSPCAPFICGATRCNGDCADDKGCAAGRYCAAGVCRDKLKDGTVCGTSNQCQNNHCVDGVCCDADCKSQCQACDVQGSMGKCTGVMGVPHGGRFHCEGAGACQGECDGVVPTACILPAEGKLCGAPSCADGVATLTASCDGKGACMLAEKKECMPYACGVTACRRVCASTHDDCAKGFECIAGECTAPDVPDGGVVEAGVAAEASVIDASTGMPSSEASAEPTAGSSAESGATAAPNEADQGSCGCRAPGHRGGMSAAWLTVSVAALLRARRARFRRRSIES